MILFPLLGRHMRSAATHFGCPASRVHAHAVATILVGFNAVSHPTCAPQESPELLHLVLHAHHCLRDHSHDPHMPPTTLWLHATTVEP